ncbi:MAG TPA: acyl-homoserine-lactone synthase [Rhizomicrobium sp.]
MALQPPFGNLMLQLIAAPSHLEFADDLAEMHRLRYRVFKERLDWDVRIADGMEVDDFDALHPTYLLQRDRDHRVCGCVRLLPTTGPNMLRDTFSTLLHGEAVPSDVEIWESSRFALDVPETASKGAGGIAVGTYELLAGLVEFGLAKNLREIVTVTDMRLERILRRASWPLRRIGAPTPIGNTQAVAGFLEVSRPALARLRSGGGFKGPVLWSPVVPASAA